MLEDKVWKIIEDNFPFKERRLREDQERIMQHPNYRLYQIKNDEGQLIGLISYWVFDDFVFVEHFAITKAFRNNGIGADVLKEFCTTKANDRLLVLEVEPLITPLAKRRVGFYQRLGFHLNGFTYMQPSYHKGGEEVPLLLMSYPKVLQYNEFSKVRRQLYREVYACDIVE